MEKYFEWFVYHKRRILIIGGIVFFILLLLIVGVWKFYFESDLKIDDTDDIILIKDNNDNLVSDSSNVEDKREEIDNDLVTVDIKGAINNPGVYQVSSIGRIKDVLDIAGGARSDADLSVINLSKKVFDEMVIIIYTKEEVNNFVEVKKQEEEKQEKCVIVEEKIINDACICDENTVINNSTNNIQNNNSNDNNKIVSLNSSSKEELMTLSGIGESKALLIIEYREANDGFKTIDELKNIKGIGDSIFEKIKEHISL